MGRRSNLRAKITIVRRCKRRIDPDNVWIKGLIDGLVKGGALEDDSFRVVEQPIVTQEIAARPETVIVIEYPD